MIAYWAIFSARFRVLLQYRAAAVAGLVTQLFWGFIRVMIFTAFYDSTTAPQPMTIAETINYVWLGQAMLLMIPWNMDRDVSELIRTGHVAYELVRPLDLYSYWFCRALALRVSPLLLRAIPIFLLAMLFFGLKLPPTWLSAALFILSSVSAILLSSAITTILSISLFWTIAGEGIVRIVPTIVMVFAGLIIPLPLLPDWLQPLLKILPFRGIMDVPFRLYMGHIPPGHAPILVVQQLAWFAVFVLLGHVLIRRALHRVVIQGG